MATLVPKANETSVHLPWGGGGGVKSGNGQGRVVAAPERLVYAE